MKTLGIVVGYIVTWLVAALRSRTLKVAIVVVGVVFLTPFVTEYWLTHIHIPDIPLSANIFMFVSTAFLFVFSVAMYLGMQMLRQIMINQRITGAPSPFTAAAAGVRATGGDFIPTDDAKLRDREDMEILKSKGILQETDVEGMASEIGHTILMKNRGRTE